MKTSILVLLFVIGSSCDPVIKETTGESITTPIESMDTNNSNLTHAIQENINPGEITLKAKVMEVYESSKDICGIPITNVMKMSVQEILERGSGIVNLPNKNDEILMNFMVAPKDLSTNSYIEAKASESLCRDSSKTYFTIISYKIVE